MMRKDHILTVIIKKDILAKKAMLKLMLKHSQLEYKKRTRFQ